MSKKRLALPAATSEKAAASGLGRPARRTTIGDVAAFAGVSLGTVSAVLNGVGRISEATREHVQRAIAELQYQPNLYASNLARRETRILGVIVSNLQNPFFAETAQAIEEHARNRGFQVTLMATNFSAEQHRSAVRQLLGARIAGLAVMTSEDDKASRDMVVRSGVPAVLLDFGRPTGQCSVLRVDAGGGMRAAVEHLIELGHRRLLYVRNSQHPGGPVLRSHRLRDQGFEAAVRHFAAQKITVRTVDIQGPGADAGAQAIAEVWNKFAFTAVITMTDMVALGVCRALHERNVSIPEQVSVVGFDDNYFSRFLTPPLTTVNVSREKLSQLVVKTLIERESAQLLSLPTELVIRGSTGSPPSRNR